MASMIAIICPFLVVFLRAITIFQIFGQEVTEKQIEKQELPKKLDGAYELYITLPFLVFLQKTSSKFSTFVCISPQLQKLRPLWKMNSY